MASFPRAGVLHVFSGLVAVYISGFVALFKRRARQSELTRPFTVWGYPWTTWGVLLASVRFLIASVVSDIKHSLFTLVLIAISYPVYFFAVKERTPTVPVPKSPS
jgi:APA family basic amino acid/polyamine antiporter